MGSPESSSPTPKVPIGNRAADYVEKMLASDHHIFTEDFPATENNVGAVLAELRAFPGCFHGETNSFNLDKIADWVIRNLENFRQGQMSGAPTEHVGDGPLVEEAAGPPPTAAPPSKPAAPQGTLSNPRTIHAPAVPRPGGTGTRRQPPRPAPPPPPGKTAKRPAPSRPASPPKAASSASGSFPATARPPSQRTERRIVDLTKKTHAMNKEVARLQGEVRIFKESWAMMARTLGLPEEGEGVTDAVIEAVADAVTTLEELQQERNDLLDQVHTLANAPPQDLVGILQSFPPDVIKALGPDRVGEDLADRIKRAVAALGSKGDLGSREAGKFREEAERRLRQFESAEKRLREELAWMTSERERARNERDESETEAKKAQEKAAASLKMMEQFRQKVATLEQEIEDLKKRQPAAAPSEDGLAEAVAERDRLWEVLGSLVSEVSGTVEHLEKTQRHLKRLSGRIPAVDPSETKSEPKSRREPSPEGGGAKESDNPLLEARDDEESPMGPYDPGASSSPAGEAATPKDQKTDEVHAKGP